ncbi:MAG: M20/M25/M40 family metallo-hydrolase, partial [Acidobacteriota bacterium]
MIEMAGVVRQVESQQARLLKRLRELVEVESPSEDKAAVDRAGELVAGWAIELGGRVKRHRQQEFGDVLEIRFGPRKSKRGRAMLLGHLDTVWPIGTLKRMPWTEAKGTICAPGVLDMKCGVVMELEAVAALKALGLERPVTLLLGSEEEIGSPVSRPIIERVAQECAAVFVTEPAQGLAYKTARKGVGNFVLR